MSNGAGGFWWIITNDIEEAVNQSLSALEQWSDLAQTDPEAMERLQSKRKQLMPLLDRLISTSKRGRRQGRRKH
ncbi:MAG: hypothetical protein CMH53_08010 [Myxococcales bacterium]|nr:hypothetical protein [Myxococcales bacterium]